MKKTEITSTEKLTKAELSAALSDKLSRVMGVCEDNTRKNLVYYGDTKLLSKAMNYIENSSDICVLSCFDSIEMAVENAKTGGFTRVIEITADGISEVWSK